MERFRSWDATVLGATGVALALFVALAFASIARPVSGAGQASAARPAASSRAG